MKTLRVACLSPYPDDGPSVRHRVTSYAPLWAEHGVALDVFAFATRRLYDIRRKFGIIYTAEKAMLFAFCLVRLLLRLVKIPKYNVIIVHREIFPLGPAVFERIVSRINPRVVFDFDDAIWTPPSGKVNQRALLWDPNRTSHAIACSRHVVAGNGFLERYARRYNPRVTVIPTTYDDRPPQRRRPRNDPPIVAWIGNLGNAWYVAERLRAFEQASKVAPFVLRLIGGADLDEIRSDVLQIDKRAWSENEELALIEADIGVMPLPDLDYERGKCGFKIVQYWSAALAVIASPVGVNATMISHGNNGLLAKSDEDWERALIACLTDERGRSALAAAGRHTFLEDYTRSAGARAWMDVFHQVASTEAM